MKKNLPSEIMVEIEDQKSQLLLLIEQMQL